MDLIDNFPGWLALPAVALGAVLLALAQCAVAEITLRIAAQMYAATPGERADRVEEWSRILRDMRPSERPAHAGSLLWAGIRRSPRTLYGRFQYRRGFVDGSLEGWVEGMEELGFLLAQPIGRWVRVRLFMTPRRFWRRPPRTKWEVAEGVDLPTVLKRLNEEHRP